MLDTLYAIAFFLVWLASWAIGLCCIIGALLLAACLAIATLKAFPAAAITFYKAFNLHLAEATDNLSRYPPLSWWK